MPQEVEGPPADASTKPATETASITSLMVADEQDSENVGVLPEPQTETPSGPVVQETVPAPEPSLPASEDIQVSRRHSELLGPIFMFVIACDSH